MDDGWLFLRSWPRFLSFGPGGGFVRRELSSSLRVSFFWKEEGWSSFPFCGQRTFPFFFSLLGDQGHSNEFLFFFFFLEV